MSVAKKKVESRARNRLFPWGSASLDQVCEERQALCGIVSGARSREKGRIGFYHSRNGVRFILQGAEEGVNRIADRGKYYARTGKNVCESSWIIECGGPIPSVRWCVY